MMPVARQLASTVVATTAKSASSSGSGFRRAGWIGLSSQPRLWSGSLLGVACRPRFAASAGGASSGSAGPGLVGLTGAPLTSSSAKTDAEVGAEVELTAQNAAQILQSPSAVLLQVGETETHAEKKLAKLRVAAAGRLPRVHLDCARLPQVCQALQIRSSPAVLLMARGQVAAALENDLSPQAVTAFVERAAQLLGLKVDLGGSTMEQLAEAEDIERTDATAADEAFAQVAEASDLTLEARVRAAAGRARCALRAGRADDARQALKELEAAGHGRAAEVKQGFALLRLDEFRSSQPLDDLRIAAEASPGDHNAVAPYAVALFFAAMEEEAVDVSIALVRKSRTEDVRTFALAVIEALGPRHPRAKSARRQLSSAFFV